MRTTNRKKVNNPGEKREKGGRKRRETFSKVTNPSFFKSSTPDKDRRREGG